MNRLKYFITCFICFFIFNTNIVAQNIQLKNPSFEAVRADHGTLPTFWDDCSTDFGHSPSDLHDSNSDIFGVRSRPIDGETFVGMVTRADETYESIGQFLRQPLEEGNIYRFGIYLAKSESYLSVSQVTMREENFNEPIVLRVWGGNSYEERIELLGETNPVSHRDWQEYIFEFQPSNDYGFITLEAHCDEDRVFAYRGNILIDHCSDIELIDSQGLNKIVDFSVLTNSKLLSLVLECKEADANVRDGSTLDIIFDSWHFNNKISAIGLVELLEKLDADLISHYLDIYTILDLQEPIKIINKVIATNEKTEKRLSDLSFLKGCDKDYKKAIDQSVLREKLLNFIEGNRAEVIILLEDCQAE